MSQDVRLILLLSDDTQQVFPLDDPTILLGRDDTNHIVLDDGKVSRLHARITLDQHNYTLEDAGSANGTFVNGQRITQAVLQPGDIIKLGNSRLQFERPGAVAASNETIRPAAGQRGRSADHALLSDFLGALQEQDTASTKPTGAMTIRDQLLRVPRLVIFTPQKTWELRLNNQDKWSIGRSPDNDICIQHQKVSRRHAYIERRGDDFMLRDLDSVNGTRLGQRPIQSHTLQHADTINIGNAQIVYKNIQQMEQRQDVTAQSGRTPVVVIPGNFGSHLWQGTEKLWFNLATTLRQPEKLAFDPDAPPLEARGLVDDIVVVPKIVQIENYGRIGDFLEETLQYTRGDDLLEFAYDWRDDVRVAARQLAERIEQWNPAGPVVIIAHSLGCHVARYYVDCLSGHKNVKRLVLVGGLNYGNPNALLHLLPENLKHLRPLVVSIGGSLADRIVRVFATFPMMYQLLPDYPCVFDQHNTPMNLYQDASWLATDKLPLLRSGYELFRDLRQTATIPTTCIFGYGSKTTTALKITRNQQGEWQHVEAVRTSDGDGMAPTESAILKGAEIHPVHQGHNELYVDDDVLMRLRYELVGKLS